LLPALVHGAELAGSCCVVIDVLRATTTIIHALSAGARGVVACGSIDTARASAAELPPGQAVLGGERGGLPIDGFDLGNSPGEYTSQSVGGRWIVLTTTNGTKALLHCCEAAEVLVGGFVNLSALVALLAACERVDIVCAGTDGEISREDVLLAGAIVARLTRDATWVVNDQATIARDAWITVVAGTDATTPCTALIGALRASKGGRNLVHLGMDHDIEQAAEVDRFAMVPRVDRQAAVGPFGPTVVIHPGGAG
jgi:2-phosphosulfolactate phosphatase